MDKAKDSDTFRLSAYGAASVAADFDPVETARIEKILRQKIDDNEELEIPDFLKRAN